jgi:hypothetical protein
MGKKIPSKKNKELEVSTFITCVIFGVHCILLFQNHRHTSAPTLDPVTEDTNVAGVLCVPLISRNKVKILGAFQVK